MCLLKSGFLKPVLEGQLIRGFDSYIPQDSELLAHASSKLRQTLIPGSVAANPGSIAVVVANNPGLKMS